ncbi:Multi antimicrobial extrusion protein [Penicillium odoratum]|uniref:Multi antimicrobial extrusion protein n=1 Tax=Penicillium odoratum TaxID=1167516 RepID=UPI002548B19D|nr:Multi antimicrobial extrusion protein [Penicillium odoratum]KAJ5761225.1 Multi antimicrobial extrusion protein [Penicillium odoratum]
MSHASAEPDIGNAPPDEHTPLLPDQPSDTTKWSRVEGQTLFYTREKGFFAEYWGLLKDSLPVILGYALQMSIQTTTTIIIGQSSPMNLAVAAFTQMFALVTGGMIALGGTTALDTIGSSAYTGGNKHDLGILLLRALMVLSGFFIPVAILWASSNPLFRALGQDPELAYLSSRYLTVFIPGGLGYIFFEVMKKYLQAQEIMRAGTYVMMVVLPCHIAITYLFCYTLGIGLLGAPLASDISYWLAVALLVLYSKYIAGSECWGGWSMAAFDNIWTFVRLSFLGIMHIGTEWWAFEIVALAAGRLGTIALAAQSVIMTADSVMNTIPFGLGVATSSRIGNLLGARSGKSAARTAHTSAFLAIILGSVVLVILMGSRNHFAKIFNKDPRVAELVSEIMPLVAVFQIADGLNGSCGGSLRGMGRQHIGAAVNVISYYIFALPLGIYLAFHGWGLKGLWVGQCAALYCVGIVQWIMVARSRWDKEVLKAFRRMDTHDDQ